MTFSDIGRANKKFWYIIIVCVLVCFCAAFGLTVNKNSYMASTTLIIEQDREGSEKNVDLSNEIGRQIRELDLWLTDQEFLKYIQINIYKQNEALAKNLSIEYLKSNISVSYRNGDNFFNINLTYNDKQDAMTIVNFVSDAVKEKYQEKYPVETSSTKIETLINTQIEQSMNKSTKYGIIGILIGIVIAEMIILCILGFDKRVIDSEILKRETELDILVKLDKVKGDK